LFGMKINLRILVKILFCHEVSLPIRADIKSAAFFQCNTLKKGSRPDANTDRETAPITEKNFSLKDKFFCGLEKPFLHNQTLEELISP
jgi:hypothetical protein